MKLGTEHIMQTLIERLNWPIGFVRWQAAKAFASLLSSSQRDLANRIFLDWLQSRQFETEVVAGISVLLFVPPSDLPSADKVCRSINKPSIAADFVFQEVYDRSLFNWLDGHSGPAPLGFQPDQYFEIYQGQAIPLKLSKAFEYLQKVTGRPFMEQWAFEWRELMNTTTAPHSTYPYHFVDAIRSRKEISGLFDMRQGSVYRSAFLRTLAFAAQQWGLPLSCLIEFATHCLPLSKGLHLIHPIKRPLWLKNVPEKCCKPDSSLEKLARRIIKADMESKGMRPVSLRVPINSALAEFGELSIEGLFVTSDFVPMPRLVDEYPRTMHWSTVNCIKEPLPEESIEKHRISGIKGFCVPICLDACPLTMGFWQDDYMGLGFAFPAPYIFDKSLHVESIKGWLGFTSARKRVGYWKTWNDNWTPLFANGGHTRCGGLTEVKTSLLNESAKRLGMNLAWRVEMKLWEEKNEYSPLKIITRSSFFRN